jgi:hypothetical protein
MVLMIYCCWLLGIQGTLNYFFYMFLIVGSKVGCWLDVCFLFGFFLFVVVSTIGLTNTNLVNWKLEKGKKWTKKKDR